MQSILRYLQNGWTGALSDQDRATLIASRIGKSRETIVSPESQIPDRSPDSGYGFTLDKEWLDAIKAKITDTLVFAVSTEETLSDNLQIILMVSRKSLSDPISMDEITSLLASELALELSYLALFGNNQKGLITETADGLILVDRETDRDDLDISFLAKMVSKMPSSIRETLEWVLDYNLGLELQKFLSAEALPSQLAGIPAHYSVWLNSDENHLAAILLNLRQTVWLNLENTACVRYLDNIEIAKNLNISSDLLPVIVFRFDVGFKVDKKLPIAALRNVLSKDLELVPSKEELELVLDR